MPNKPNSPLPKNIVCIHCGSSSLQRTGVFDGRQRYRCKTCTKYFIDGTEYKPYGPEDIRTANIMLLAGCTKVEIQHAMDRAYTTIDKWVKNADSIVQLDPQLSLLKKTKRRKVGVETGLRSVANLSKKRWLIIELEGDPKELPSIIVTNPTKK